MCPACQAGNHIECYDEDVTREKLELGNIFNDGPVPWFGCVCTCEDGVLRCKHKPHVFEVDGNLMCGSCARALLGRCPTCSKPNQDEDCRAYRP